MPFVFPTEPTGDAAGRYADQSDVEDIFGAYNVMIWSQLEGGTDETNVARIQKAIDNSEAKIDAHFRGGPYTVPLSASPMLTEWAAKLAGIWLWQCRGIKENEDEPKNSYAAMEQSVWEEMGRAKSDSNFLDATLIDSAAPTAPVVVE